MLRTVLACFGYVKVPKEAVILSMRIEDGYRILANKMPFSENTQRLYRFASVIREFLQTGRMVQR